MPFLTTLKNQHSTPRLQGNNNQERVGAPAEAADLDEAKVEEVTGKVVVQREPGVNGARHASQDVAGINPSSDLTSSV